MQVSLRKGFFLDDALFGLLHVRGDTVGLDERIRFLDVILLGVLDELLLELLLVEVDGVVNRRNTNFDCYTVRNFESIITYCRLAPCWTTKSYRLSHRLSQQ